MITNSTLSGRQVGRLLKKLCIHENDIVLVKPSEFDRDEVMEVLRRGVEFLKLKQVYLVMVEDFEDIKVMNRQDMQAHGWYHISDINRITRMRR
jgi:hypothetical protein